MYKFPPSLSGLKTLHSDYITNSYNLINEGNLTVSGILQSPLTSLLSVSSDVLDNKIYTLGVSSGILDNKIYNLGVSSGIIDNKIYTLNVSSGIIDNKIYTLGVSHTNLNLDLQTTKNLLSTSTSNLQFTDTFLQNQIDTLVLLGITGTNIDVLFGISGTIWDSKIYTLNVSSDILDNKVYDNGIDILTLQNLSVSFDNRITVGESDIYNLNVTTNLSLDRLDDLELETFNQDSRIQDLELFNLGATFILGTTGYEEPETVIESIQDFSDKINIGFQAVNTAVWSYNLIKEIQINGIQATLSGHLAEWSGYQILQEAEDTAQNTTIGINSAAIVANGVLISANTASNISNSLDISTLGVSTGVLDNKVFTLGVSVGVLDSFKNSFSLSTTTHLNSIDSSITNLGTSLNTNNTRLNNYEDRIDLNTLDITFKGSTLNSMILTDSGLSITGNLTVSGTLQSPLTSLLSVSSGILDTFRTTMVSTTMPQYLTRNETVIPSSFVSSSLTKLGVSAIVGKAGTDTLKYKFQVGSDNSTLSNPEDTKVVFSSGGEVNDTIIYLGTPNNPSDGYRAMKTAIIAEGLGSYSRNKLHFCMSNTLDNNENTGNATLNNSLVSLDYNGLLSITGNLTVSGVLQSPITNLLGVSSGIIDGKVYNLGVSSGIIDGKVYNLGVSSGIIDGKIYNLGVSHSNLSSYVYSLNNSTLGVSIDNNTTNINTNSSNITTLGISQENLSSYVYSLNNSVLGVSIDNNSIDIGTLNVSSGINSAAISSLDTFRTTMISTTMPQFLTRNETVLPSSFTTWSGNNNKIINTSDNIFLQSSGQNCYLNFDTSTLGTNGLLGFVSDDLQFRNPEGVFSFQTGGTNEKFRINQDGNSVFTNNLTVSGTLQSPLTSLLGVSSGILDTFRTTMVSTTMPMYLTRNETTLPSSFLSSSLTSLGTITTLRATRAGLGRTNQGFSTLEIKSNGTGSGGLSVLPQNDNAENSIYFPTSSTNAGYVTGVTGTWVIGTNVGGFDNNSFDIWNPNLEVRNFKLDISGHAHLTNNLTVSGVLQSPLTSLLSVSSGINSAAISSLDIFRTTMVSTTMPQYLTRNETVLPSTFTTANLNIFQGTDNYIFKGGTSTNSYLQYQNNTYGTNKCYTGLINGNLRLYSPLNIEFYTNDGTLNGTFNTGNLTLNNNLTVSGVIQSPLTSLLGVSVNNKISNSGDQTISSGRLTITGSGKDFKHTDGSNSTWFGVFDNDGHINSTNNLRLYSNGGNLNMKLLASSNEIYKTTTITAGTDPLILSNSGGNCSFKMTGGSFTYRYETQTNDTHYLWDGANNESSTAGMVV